MSSYIKFMFKYLFEPEALPAELLANGDGLATQHGAATATATGQVDVVFVLDPAEGGGGGSSGQPPLVGSPSFQLPVNYSSGPSSSSSSSSDNMTRPHEASSSIMVNKSLVDAAVAGTRRLASVGGRAAGQGWLQQAEQLQSADSGDGGGGNSKLWPPNCLGFARMFAMAQNSQHNGGVANGTTTTTTATATMVSSSNNSHGGGLLAARLGSFAEFEHLIRQQLAALARGINGGGGGNSSIGDGNSQRATRGITGAGGGSDASGAFYSPSSSGGGQHRASNTSGPNPLARLLIRSIGHADATTTTPHEPRLELGRAETAMMSTHGPASLISTAPVSLAQLEEQQQQHQPLAVQVNSLELLECYNQLQLNDYYQGYDIFIGLRIASTLSILFIVFILFVIYKTGCRDGERTSRSQLRLTSSGNGSGNADKSCSPLSSTTSTNSLVSKQRRPNRGKRKGKEKYHQHRGKKRQKKINSTCSGGGGEIDSQPRDPCHRGSFAYINARANTSGPLEARTNKDNQAPSPWSSLTNDESLFKQQQLPSERRQHPSVMVVIEDDSSATAISRERSPTSQGGCG